MATDTNRSRDRPQLSLALVVGLSVALFGSSIVGQFDLAARLATSTATALLVNAATMWLLVGGLLVTGVAVAVFDLRQPETLTTIGSLSLPVKLTIVATAVVTEEILWRGYPIERLTELTGRVWVGAVTSFAVFLAVHYPAWGLVGALPQAVFALALVGVYVGTRNVVACILTHAVINVVMILVVPALV